MAGQRADSVMPQAAVSRIAELRRTCPARLWINFASIFHFEFWVTAYLKVHIVHNPYIVMILLSNIFCLSNKFMEKE